MHMRLLVRLVVTLLLAILSSRAACAGDSVLAPTPPMGWNSWDAYAQTITESQVRANAEWMAKRLKRFGWKYVVVDEGWYVVNPEADQKDYKLLLNEDGIFVPVASRFPSALGNAGFKPLADYVHSLGLQFGIHLIRGIPRAAVAKNLSISGSRYHAQDAADSSDTCPWNAYNYGVKNSEAGQAYYDSMMRQYAIWGVDFLKVDCISDHPYKPDEIRMLAEAIKKSRRRMLLSLSPGPTAIAHADEVAQYSEMWRISDDFWDHWGVWEKHEFSQGLYAQFANAAQWSAHVAPGKWPDADMLPLGHLGPHPGDGEVRDTRLTQDEQRTMMTLWSIFRSPLILGGNLPLSDKWTTSLLTNPEVIAVDQHSRDNRAVVTTATESVWLAQPGDLQLDRAPEQGYFLAVFNLGESERTLHYEWENLGLPKSNHRLRDLWKRKELGSATSLTVKLRPHASVLYQVDRHR